MRLPADGRSRHRQRKIRAPTRAKVRDQGFDDPAFGNGPSRTAAADTPKFIREALKIGDFPLNRCEVLGCDKVHFAAVPVGLVDKRQQSPHFVETEAKITAAAHKPQTLQMRRFIDAIVAACARRDREKALLLIPADRLDLGAGRFRQCADCQHESRP